MNTSVSHTLSIFQSQNQRDLDKLPDETYKLASSYLNKEHVKKINLAYCVAKEAHIDQKRKEGSPYISHPVEVANILLSYRLDYETVCAGLMHDVLEDSHVQKNSLEKLFGKDIANLVDGVSKLNKMEFSDILERNAQSIQKMALAMSKDIRVIVIKLCDRLHNMRTIKFLPREKQIKKSKETLELYGPIAIRIGMQSLRAELEDLAFECLHPMRAKLLKSAIASARRGRIRIIYRLKKHIKYSLAKNGVKATVQGREKAISSIYQKIKIKKKPFSEIFDVFAFRVIVESAEDAYRTLGVVHNIFKPIEQRFKDYIAIPKTNGYQALHTTLIADNGIPIEIQIQTKSMESVADNGIAAHWAYKSNDSSGPRFIGAKKWAEGLQKLNLNSKDSHEFIESLKTDLFNDEVYVFTPKGEIVNLKNGSTPIDLAYELHTDLGNKAIACKVNRKYAPLNIQLDNGQSIEIITGEEVAPDPAWLNFVVTSKARSAIRATLRHQKVSHARKIGRVMLESELKREGSQLSDYRGSKLEQILNSIGASSLNTLLTDLGLGKKTSNLVAKRFTIGRKTQEENLQFAEENMKLEDHMLAGVSVIYAKCCLPVKGDPIVAHTDTERGVVIHHARCRQIVNLRSKQSNLFSIIWGEDTQDRFYKAHIRVLAEDRPGILADVASVFASQKINIYAVNSKDIDAVMQEFFFEAEFSDIEMVKKLMIKVRAVKSVTSCTRIVNDERSKNEKTN
ncbi:MAG: bifunctional (p)ppGpp synthetase/guanosine-3',5'-bis(diphosphate) 3'-pyrophosphohydrolase [Gammaproteobacteria bacterium]